jgi:hypothetical protein
LLVNLFGIPVASVGGIAVAMALGKFGLPVVFLGFIGGCLVIAAAVGWLQHRFVPLVVRSPKTSVDQ